MWGRGPSGQSAQGPLTGHLSAVSRYVTRPILQGEPFLSSESLQGGGPGGDLPSSLNGKSMSLYYFSFASGKEQGSRVDSRLFANRKH